MKTLVEKNRNHAVVGRGALVRIARPRASLIGSHATPVAVLAGVWSWKRPRGRPVRPSTTGSRPATESRALLSQCRDLARSKLSRIVAEALDKVENDLFAAAEASTSRAEQQVLFEAMSQVKTHRREISASFDRYFIEIYDRRIAIRAPVVPGAAPSLGELTLVDDAAMEEDLVVNDLARKTRNRIDPEQLLGIRARFGHLLSKSEQVEDDTSNPLCPEAVFEALKMACGKIPGDFAVKRSLLNAFQPYVAAGHHHRLRRRQPEPDLAPRPAAHQAPGEARRRHRRRPASNPALAASQAMNLAQLMGGAQGAAARR